MCQRNRVKTATVGSMIIVAAASDWRKTDITIHRDGRIPVPDFKVDARYSVVSRLFQKGPE